MIAIATLVKNYTLLIRSFSPSLSLSPSLSFACSFLAFFQHSFSKSRTSLYRTTTSSEIVGIPLSSPRQIIGREQNCSGCITRQRNSQDTFRGYARNFHAIRKCKALSLSIFLSREARIFYDHVSVIEGRGLP